MRGIAYAIAALASVIIMVAVAKMPSESSQADSASPSTTTVASEVTRDAGTLTIAVPDMHCSVSCYPRVKELLENSEAVETVELAEQKEAGIIDNRQVVVHYQSGFNVRQALSDLEKEGFAKSDVVH